MATKLYILVGRTIIPLFEQLALVWDILTTTTVRDLMLLHLPDPNDRPLLHELVQRAIDWFADYMPVVSETTMLEFVCGSTLVLLIVFSLIRWVLDTVL